MLLITRASFPEEEGAEEAAYARQLHAYLAPRMLRRLKHGVASLREELPAKVGVLPSLEGWNEHIFQRDLTQTREWLLFAVPGQVPRIER